MGTSADLEEADLVAVAVALGKNDVYATHFFVAFQLRAIARAFKAP